MLRIMIYDDKKGTYTDVGKLGEFTATLVDEVGKDFVDAMCEGMGNIALVMTKKQFKTKADAVFDKIELQMKAKGVSALDRIIQRIRDERAR